MKTSKEIRAEAWALLFRGGWFWRCFSVALLMGVLTRLPIQLLLKLQERVGVPDWVGYFQARAANLVTVTTPVPNLTGDYIWRASLATALTVFVYFIVAGIAAYGFRSVLLKAARNDPNRWLESSFAGLKRPLELAGFYLYYTLILLFGTLCFVVPGIIAFYRYRYVLYVKLDHPDWGVFRCFGECRWLMKGHKMRSFRLDCSYWAFFLWPLLASLAMSVGVVLVSVGGQTDPRATLLVAGGALLALAGVLALFAGALVAGYYVSLGQTLLYRELAEGRGADAA